jgi:hypothetical protein
MSVGDAVQQPQPPLQRAVTPGSPSSILTSPTTVVVDPTAESAVPAAEPTVGAGGEAAAVVEEHVSPVIDDNSMDLDRRLLVRAWRVKDSRFTRCPNPPLKLLWPSPQRITQFKGPHFILRQSVEIYFAPHHRVDDVHIDWVWDYFRCVEEDGALNGVGE